MPKIKSKKKPHTVVAGVDVATLTSEDATRLFYALAARLGGDRVEGEKMMRDDYGP